MDKKGQCGYCGKNKSVDQFCFCKRAMSDRVWLLRHLNECRANYGLPLLSEIPKLDATRSCQSCNKLTLVKNMSEIKDEDLRYEVCPECKGLLE